MQINDSEIPQGQGTQTCYPSGDPALHILAFLTFRCATSGF